MKETVLVISTCKEKLHELEFVKPLETILINEKIEYSTKHYLKINKEDLISCSKIIVCGTSLKDNEFCKKENFKSFEWIKRFDRPLLGICAGMQIMGLIFEGELKKGTEIGFFKESFTSDFLSLKGDAEVYHLHNNYLNHDSLVEFKVFSKNKKEIVQAIKHKSKSFYGVLFHPEVRNKNLILEFVKNG